MVPYCNFSVHTAANMYKREIPHPQWCHFALVVCPLDSHWGGCWPVISTDKISVIQIQRAHVKICVITVCNAEYM